MRSEKRVFCRREADSKRPTVVIAIALGVWMYLLVRARSIVRQPLLRRSTMAGERRSCKERNRQDDRAGLSLHET
jgi:hypothetical protein